MRWKGRRGSTNVEDRRGMRAGPVLAGGGIGTVVIALIVFFLGGDPGAVVQTGPDGCCTAAHRGRPAARKR